MGFETLKFLKRTHPRIVIIQPHNESTGEQPIIHVIQKRAAIGARIQGPSHRVSDETLPMFFFFNLP